MKNVLGFILLLSSVSCTTIHFRSNNTIPVSFEGNPKHPKEIAVTGQRNFYFWGVDPEYHEVFIDEEVRKAGYDAISKLIIYEQKNPQDILISFLTFCLYIPRAYTITGYSSGNMLPEDSDDSASKTIQK